MWKATWELCCEKREINKLAWMQQQNFVSPESFLQQQQAKQKCTSADWIRIRQSRAEQRIRETSGKTCVYVQRLSFFIKFLIVSHLEAFSLWEPTNKKRKIPLWSAVKIGKLKEGEGESASAATANHEQKLSSQKLKTAAVFVRPAFTAATD